MIYIYIYTGLIASYHVLCFGVPVESARMY